MGAYIGDVPAIFRFADMQAKKERMNNVNERRQRLGPRTKPVPRIQSSETIRGPLFVTQEYKDAKNKEKKKKRDAEKLEQELDLAQLLSKKARWEARLAVLNPAKKKDSEEMARLNIKLRRNEERIEEAKEVSGITDFNELKQGSKLARFWERTKARVSKVVKTVKKWFKKHSEAIEGAAIIALPFLAFGLLKKFIAWLL
jgi:hypothetical protein